jgi:hypothetical protein
MAYTQDQLASGLETLNDTTIASGDLLVAGDASDSGRLKAITWSNILTAILAYIDDAAATLTNKTINASNNTVTNVSLTTGITGTLPIGNGGTGQITAALAFGALKQAASDSATGVVELATAAETTTGTDAARAVTPDGLAGSDYGKRVVGILVVDPASNTATGDGKAVFRVPSVLNGWNLVAVAAMVYTAGTTGTTDVQIRNKTDAQDMLSTKITIDSTETDSSTAAAAVINTSFDDVATGDHIAIDVDAVSTTPARGLYVEMIFQLP